MRFSITVTPVISSTPDYTIGDSLGVKMAQAGCFAGAGQTTITLVSAMVRDLSNTGPDFRLFFFDGALTGTYTDNGAFTPSSADKLALQGVLAVVNANYATFGTMKYAKFSDINEDITGYADLGMVFIADSAYNAASTSDLSVTLTFEVK